MRVLCCSDSDEYPRHYSATWSSHALIDHSSAQAFHPTHTNGPSIQILYWHISSKAQSVIPTHLCLTGRKTTKHDQSNFQRITDSPNRQGVEGPLLGSPSPTSLFKQGPLRACYLGHCPERCPSPVRETPPPFWATFVALSHHHSKVFPSHVEVGIPWFQFLLVASYPIAWHHQEEPGSIILTPSFKYWYTWMKTPHSPLQPNQAQLPQPPS